MFVIFRQKKNGTEAASKMFLKLATGLHFAKNLQAVFVKKEFF